jgi:flagellar hook protein FlgE
MAVGSFSAGLSGLNANATYLSVIGNNLANINTIGFKASTVSFTDLVSQTMGGTSINPMQVGLGVATGSISPVFSQGSIENTREATNVAIQGNGFFVVRGNDERHGLHPRRRTSASTADGELVTPDGWACRATRRSTRHRRGRHHRGSPTDITVPPGVPCASPSRRPSSDGHEPRRGRHRRSAATTFTTSVQIYDALGSPHIATITYENTGPRAAGRTSLPCRARTSSEARRARRSKSPTARFSSTPPDGSTAAGAQRRRPADMTILTPDLGQRRRRLTKSSGTSSTQTASPTLTGFSSPSATSSKTQNGSRPADQRHQHLADGTIVATFGAGQTVVVGQLALANFNNPKGLVKMGEQPLRRERGRRIANIGIPGTGGRGTVIGNALEGRTSTSRRSSRR